MSDVWHGRGVGTQLQAPDPPGRDPSYGTLASFADPDGNRYLLQEITQRLPGRE